MEINELENLEYEFLSKLYEAKKNNTDLKYVKMYINETISNNGNDMVEVINDLYMNGYVDIKIKKGANIHVFTSISKDYITEAGIEYFEQL